MKTLFNGYIPVTRSNSSTPMIDEIIEQLSHPANSDAFRFSDSINNLPVDIYENNRVLYVKVAIPGIAAENVEISLEKNLLTIKGETSAENTNDDTVWHRREYSYGAFSRTIRVPKDIQFDKVNATMNQGFITISLPRSEEEIPTALKIPIRIQKQAEPVQVPMQGKEEANHIESSKMESAKAGSKKK